jgi:hypothetical protein
MFRVEQYAGGIAYINPKDISFISQNTVKDYEHLTIINVRGNNIITVGNATDLYQNIFSDVAE